MGDSSIQLWILGGINGFLIIISGYFISNWMSSIKESMSEQDDNFKNLKKEYQEEVTHINREMGKRKGETDLLRKDVEKLASDTSHNFDSLKTHLSYQKTSLEEIKEGAKERKAEMDSHFKTIIELVNNKKND